MRKWDFSDWMAFITMMLALLIGIFCSKVYGAEPEPELMRVTCYHYNSGITASGTTPVSGRTAGARKDMIGSVVLLYENDNGKVGDFIGMRMIEDTGDAPRIQTGKSIDVFQDSYADCKEWVKAYGDYLYVYVIRGKG